MPYPVVASAYGVLVALFSSLSLASLGQQEFSVKRVDPPHWFAGMEHPALQLVLYGNGLSNCGVEISPEIPIDSVVYPPNDHYALVYLQTADARPGQYTITCRAAAGGNRTESWPFELKPLSTDPNRINGLNPSDFMYLIMPDRFANGDPGNDVVEGMQETKLNRGWMYDRHGGDLQGVINHLDYLEALGVTALWLNPVLENDQPKTSYHGYATTDSYAIDPRFGSTADYISLGDTLQARGMKLIKDVIYNHWGDQHWMVIDPPDSSWINHWESFNRTSHRPYVLYDPYASERDTRTFTDGWFDHHMPDLNPRNPHLASYLTQQTLWWIEVAGLDGLRIDTYYYPDQTFMSALVHRVEEQFPNCFVFGETWIRDQIALNYVMDEVGYRNLPRSALDGLTDFPLYFATIDALTRDPGWESGAIQWYIALANDAVLPYRPDHVVFLDNHDLSRFLSVVGDDPAKLKLALAFLLTTRGIPMIYYGTEIGLNGFCDPDGKVRQDFPGGWAEDAVDCFSEAGRQGLAAELHDFVQHLANWRKRNPWLGKSALMHFIPEAGTYVYFRYTDEKAAMVLLNPTGESQSIDFNRFDELLKGTRSFSDAMTGRETVIEADAMVLPALEFRVLEFQR